MDHVNAHNTQRDSSRSPSQKPLRVLHIGNIANNAYRNVKLLNEAGLDCDVLCYDYYHLMGAPEWEDAEIEGAIHDQFYPNWSAVNLNGFRRPRWFAQGPPKACIRYLLAKRRHQRMKAQYWWLVLELRRWWLCGARQRGRRIESLKTAKKSLGSVGASVRTVQSRAFDLVRKKTQFLTARIRGRRLLRRIMLLPGSLFFPLTLAFKRTDEEAKNEFDRRASQLVALFAQVFPCRSDQLSLYDLEMWRPLFPFWKELFGEYDIVQGYSIDPWFPLLCDKRPYVGYEHGTLRDIPFDATLQGRIAALAYALADGVFITNGDCVSAVPKLGIRHAVPMLHAVDEREYMAAQRGSEELHARFGVRYVFLCTLRHDWRIKGTDVYLRALPLLAKALDRNFKLLLTQWGAEIEDSKKLISELGVSDLVHWMEPIPRRRLIGLQKSVDVVFDQIALPHFGATAPEAIAAGVPVLMSYDPDSTKWIVSEPAPILSAWTPEEVVQQVLVALDPEWQRQFRERARKWSTVHHSVKRVIQGHLDMYRYCLEKRG